MRNLFNPRLNSELDSLVTSSAVVLAGVPPASFARILSTDSSGTILKNGEDVGTVTSVVTGDSLQIQAYSSHAFATPTFISYDVAGHVGAFTIATRPSELPQSLTGFNPLIPLDLTAIQAATSSEFGPDVSCVVSQYDKQDGSYVRGLSASNAYVEAERGSWSGITFPNYYSSVALQLDPTTFETVGMAQVGLQPYGSCVAADLTWITLAGQSNVVAVDDSNSVVHTIAVGQRPLGIASWLAAAGTTWHIVVACNNSAIVSHIRYSSVTSTWTTTTISTGSKSFEVAIDTSGYAWVTSTTGALHRINLADDTFVAVTALASGSGPRGIVYNAVKNKVHVACSLTNKVVSFDCATLEQTFVATSLLPYSIAADTNGDMYCACFKSGVVQVFNGLSLLRTIAVDAYPYAIRISGTTLLVTNYYGIPALALDQTSLGFGIIDPETVPQRTVLGTSTFTVTGLGAPTVCATPVSMGATILKNGLPSGSRTTVVTGDTLSFTFTTPNVAYEEIDIPIFVGNIGESFKTITSVEDVTPDLTSFSFDPITDATYGATYASSPFTVTGIDPLVTLTLTTTEGSIILNGVDTGSTVAVVKSNDVVSLQAVAPRRKNQTTRVTVTLALHDVEWQIATRVETPYWIQQTHKGVGELDTAFSPALSGQLFKFTSGGVYQGSYDMHAVPSGENTRNVSYFFLTSYWEDCVYRVAADGTLAEVFQLPEGSRPQAVCSTPKLSKSFNALARQLVTLSGSNAVHVLNSPEPDIALPGSPRSIVASDDGANVYVTLPDIGKVAVLSPTGPGAPYYLRTVIAIGGKPHEAAMWGKKVIVSDISNDSLHVISNDVAATTTFKTGRGVWDMEVVTDTLWTANSYDNTVSKISLNQPGIPGYAIRVGSVPNGVSYYGGRVSVSHYAQPEMLFIQEQQAGQPTAYGMDTLGQTAPNPSMGVMSTDQGIFTSALYSNLALGEGSQDILIAELPMEPLVWPEMLDQARGTVIRSETATVQGVPRTLQLSAAPSAIYKVLCNDVYVTGPFDVVDGDRIVIEVTVPDTYNVDVYVRVSSYNVTSTFHVRSEAYKIMDPVKFIPMSGVKIREVLTTNTVSVQGLSEGALGPVSVFNSEWVEWTVIINGVLQSATPRMRPNGLLDPHVSYVKNGDTLALHGICRGQYNSTTEYILLSNDVPVGSLFASNILLDGPESENTVYRAAHLEIDNTLDSSIGSQCAAHEPQDASSSPVLLTRATYEALGPDSAEIMRRSLLISQDVNLPMLLSGSGTSFAGDSVQEFVAYASSPAYEFDQPLALQIRSTFGETLDSLVAEARVSSALAVAPEPTYFLDSSQAAMLGPKKEFTRDDFSTLLTETAAYEKHVSGERVTADAGWERAAIYTRRSLFGRFIKAKTATPLRYSVVYSINEKHALLTPDEEFINLKGAPLRTFEPEPVKHAYHVSPTTMSSYEAFVPRAPLLADTGYERHTHERTLSTEAEWVRGASSTVEVAELEFERSAMRTLFDLEFVPMLVSERQVRLILLPDPERADSTGAIAVDAPVPQQTSYEARLGESPVPIAEAYRDSSYRVPTTAADQGLFDTEALALAYAATLGYVDGVQAVQVGDFFSWTTPARRQGADCSIVANRLAIPYKWYVHGG